jgi:hypothetical protein
LWSLANFRRVEVRSWRSSPCDTVHDIPCKRSGARRDPNPIVSCVFRGCLLVARRVWIL